MEDVQLSPNFKLSVFTKSPIAQRFNRTEQYNPPKLIIDKLRALCVNHLELVLAAVKKHYPSALLRHTSGYRCPFVNEKAGGAETSQHLAGEADDKELVIDGREENLLLAQLILNENIPFDQMILEYGPRISEPEWIHTSWDLDKPHQRGMILRYEYNKEGKMVSYQVTKATVLNLRRQ